MKAPRASQLLALLLLVSLCQSGTAPPATPLDLVLVGYSTDELGPEALPGPRLYVALGDSYSSGEGAPYDDDGGPGWLGDTDAQGSRCHRSAHAYGPRVWGVLDARDPSWGVQFRACSGATTGALWTDFKGNPPQFDAFDDGPADLVTIGFGGNDIGFADIVRGCVLDSVSDRYTVGLDELRSCKRSGEQTVAESLDSVRNNLRAGFGQLVDPSFLGEPPRVKAGGKIMAIGYPRPFPDDPSGPCSLGTGSSIGTGTMRWVNEEVVDALNAVIREEAQRAGIFFVDTSDYFSRSGRHDFCIDGSERWITRIVPSDKQRSVHPKFPYHKELTAAIVRCWDLRGADPARTVC